MDRVGINWALAVGPVLISAVPQHISYLQSSLHSMPMWEREIAQPHFAKMEVKQKEDCTNFSSSPKPLWRWVESKPCCPNLPSSQSPELTKHSAIKLSLQKSVLTVLQYLSLPKAFFLCFFFREPTSSISWKPDPCLLLCYGIHCKAPIDTKRYDCIPHIHCS